MEEAGAENPGVARLLREQEEAGNRRLFRTGINPTPIIVSRKLIFNQEQFTERWDYDDWRQLRPAVDIAGMYQSTNIWGVGCMMVRATGLL
jgi:hypothetical protein